MWCWESLIEDDGLVSPKNLILIWGSIMENLSRIILIRKLTVQFKNFLIGVEQYKQTVDGDRTSFITAWSQIYTSYLYRLRADQGPFPISPKCKHLTNLIRVLLLWKCVKGHSSFGIEEPSDEAFWRIIQKVKVAHLFVTSTDIVQASRIEINGPIEGNRFYRLDLSLE